jgi:hypothetical protein
MASGRIVELPTKSSRAATPSDHRAEVPGVVRGGIVCAPNSIQEPHENQDDKSGPLQSRGSRVAQGQWIAVPALQMRVLQFCQNEGLGTFLSALPKTSRSSSWEELWGVVESALASR